MSEHKKKPKVIHVDNLVIHAKHVKVINEDSHHGHHPRNPWEFLWGRPRQAVEDTRDEEHGK